ncbi:uncharacterized protein LOC110458091 [Mizuhopecten yessoensis]|uniref:Uncharacterized protein n=1 Tax=Mizuhopecten yessoensis TaxID=6573 RepID=A0A210Q7B2_MIZYE|nr:uncharacterized protein LOC110458091 [Mizuhopecten yessoensis]OWF44626.1 hypothetical protein KP79_PYT05477 [Mizuhopecten yessoensis]
MGKDKRSDNISHHAIPFRTKESLKKDNNKLSRELRELQRRFQEVSNVVHHLELDYESSKDSPPPMRYNMLKEMIKRSTTDDILEKSRPPSPKDVKAAAKRAGAEDLAGTSRHFAGSIGSSNSHRSQDSLSHQKLTGRGALEGTTGGLLASCRGFAGMSDQSAGTSENKIASREMRLSKKEVATDNDQICKEIVGFESRFLRIHNRLTKLRQDYENSKAMVFLNRYAAMKSMIKVVIQDKKLTS